MNFKHPFIIIFAVFQTLCMNAQNHAGIAGKRNLIGYNGEIWTSPIGYMGKFTYERMIDYRTNVGIAFTRSSMSTPIGKSTYNYQGRIHTEVDGNKKYIADYYGVDGDFQFRIRGFEIYIKRFRKKNPMRNFGTFWTYKIGRHHIETTIPEGTGFRILESPTSGRYDYHISTNEGKYNIRQMYAGFELGKTYPWFNGKILFSLSGSININFNKTPDGSDISFKEYSNTAAGIYIADNQLFSLNFGFAYAL